MGKLRELSWKDFCDGLDKDPPDDVQKEAEHVFFDHVFPEALLTFSRMPVSCCYFMKQPSPHPL